MTKLHVVVTTIQPPTTSILNFAAILAIEHAQLIVVGDQKGPTDFSQISKTSLPSESLVFLDVISQVNSGFELAKSLPFNHYSRKNIGYLQAMSLGASSIYETDDDNAPMDCWKPRHQAVDASKVEPREWLNAYGYFSELIIWPRGFPLDEICSKNALLPLSKTQQCVTAPIQQGLANGSPDVDAIWRLVLDEAVEFDNGPSVWLPPGSWCPFNSQSTWWWPEAYPLMYLPSYCSFRMTDIWRSFIAQRCLWELGYGLVFHPPEVFQDRNEHYLMRDFSDEVVGYLRNKELVNILAGLSLKAGPESQSDNLQACYAALAAAGFFPRQELDLVHTWLEDITGCMAIE